MSNLLDLDEQFDDCMTVAQTYANVMGDHVCVAGSAPLGAYISLLVAYEASYEGAPQNKLDRRSCAAFLRTIGTLGILNW